MTNSQNPYLNLGCGKVQLPCDRPVHHGLVNEAIYHYPLWYNVDKVDLPGVDEAANIFTYPWPWADNSYDGALLSHLVEHIPHEIQVNDPLHHRESTQVGINGPVHYVPEATPEEMAQSVRAAELRQLQDGWYAFFSELYRVLSPGAIAHILAPYGWSQGAITDPTHCRLITEHTFSHSMTPNGDGPFQYNNGGINFPIVGSPVFRPTQLFAHIADQMTFQRLLQTQINVAYEVYVQLEAVKDGG